MARDRAAFLWRAVFAAVGWAALALKFWLMARSLPELNLFALTLRYFSFFTILGTVLVVLALTAPVVAPNSRLGRWAEAPGSARRCRCTYWSSPWPTTSCCPARGSLSPWT